MIEHKRGFTNNDGFVQLNITYVRNDNIIAIWKTKKCGCESFDNEEKRDRLKQMWSVAPKSTIQETC